MAIPLEALRYGVVVIRGPDWDFGDQDGGVGGLGLTVPPDHDHLREWMFEGFTGGCGGRWLLEWGMWDGGWWWDRSQVVLWDRTKSTCYYKAGDGGCFDCLELIDDKNSGPVFDQRQKSLQWAVLEKAQKVMQELRKEFEADKLEIPIDADIFKNNMNTFNKKLLALHVAEKTDDMKTEKTKNTTIMNTKKPAVADAMDSIKGPAAEEYQESIMNASIRKKSIRKKPAADWSGASRSR